MAASQTRSMRRFELLHALREQLKQFYLVQANKSLCAIMSSIRDASRNLRVGLTETEITQVILEGVTPEER